MTFTEGEEVLAKYPNSAEYHKGTITGIRGDRYKIQFEPGIEHTVHLNDIKAGRASRSTTRAGGKVGRRSPARSPGRSSGRSPGRSPRRSPSRRSPGRSPMSNRKLPLRSTRLAKISLSRIDVANDKGSDNTLEEKIFSTKSMDDSPTDGMPLQSRLNEMGSVTRRSTRLLLNSTRSDMEHSTIAFMRNINRAVSLPLERKSQLLGFTHESKERGQSVQRDQDLLKTLNYEENVQPDGQTEKRKKEISFVNEPQEWGGWIGTLFLIFLLPFLIIVPQLFCSKDQCGFNHLKVPTALNAYINFHAFLAYSSFLIFMAITSIMPIGKCIDGQQSKVGRLQYRVNGLLSGVIALIIFSACLYKDIKISDFILDNFLQLSISGYMLGAILSILLYIKGNKAAVANLNMYACTNSVIYNFWQGREINPRIGKLDFKIILLRSALVGTFILNLAILFKAIEESESLSFEHFNVAVILATSLQIFCCLDILIFESSILTSFEVTYEGTGYMLCAGYLLYPFLPTLTTRYILYEKPEFSYFYGILVLTFIIGYLVFRISNSQKDEFRRNPLSPSLSHLETIPTTRGKKLIVSGLWGYVRHPNYLGDIIMQWSIACLSLACDVLPYYTAITLTSGLIHRALRDNERCKQRYGLAWEQYTSRVKYMILNRVF